MNDKTRKMVMTKAIEMYASLAIAVDEAGGVGFSIKELQEMTVMDLFNSLATNNVRFVYSGPNKKVKLGDMVSPDPGHLVTVEYAVRVINGIIEELKPNVTEDERGPVAIGGLQIQHLFTFLSAHPTGTFKI